MLSFPRFATAAAFLLFSQSAFGQIDSSLVPADFLLPAPQPNFLGVVRLQADGKDCESLNNSMKKITCEKYDIARILLAGATFNAQQCSGECEGLHSSTGIGICDHLCALLKCFLLGHNQPETKKSFLEKQLDFSKRAAAEYHSLVRQIGEAKDAWKSDATVSAAVFDQPATFPDPESSPFESGKSIVIREGMQFTSNGHGKWQVVAPYTPGHVEAELHLQVRFTIPGGAEHTITMRPVCVPAREACRSTGCSGAESCSAINHADCASSLKLSGYSAVLDEHNGQFTSAARNGYAIYGTANTAGHRL